MLARCLQHGVPVIAKSTHRERIQENAQIFDFGLSGEDMAKLDALDQTNGTDRARKTRGGEALSLPDGSRPPAPVGKP